MLLNSTDLSEGPTSEPLAPAETDDTMIIATSAAGAAAVVIIVIVVVVAVVICCKFKTVRYIRRQESRERKLGEMTDQLTTLYAFLRTPTTHEHLEIIQQEIKKYHGYINGTNGGLICDDAGGAPETGKIMQQSLVVTKYTMFCFHSQELLRPKKISGSRLRI